MATGPDLKISKVGAEAYFVRNTDFFRSIFSFPKKCIDIGTLSVFVENVTESFAIGSYSAADSWRIPQHPHRITGRGKGVDNDVLFFRFKVFLLGIIGKSAFLGHGETGCNLNCRCTTFKILDRFGSGKNSSSRNDRNLHPVFFEKILNLNHDLFQLILSPIHSKTKMPSCKRSLDNNVIRHPVRPCCTFEKRSQGTN